MHIKEAKNKEIFEFGFQILHFQIYEIPGEVLPLDDIFPFRKKQSKIYKYLFSKSKNINPWTHYTLFAKHKYIVA